MAVFYRKKNVRPAEEENPYWMSFSDMMAGILIIFILVCSALVFKLSQMDEQIKENIQQLVDDLKLRDTMLNEVRQQLARLELYVDVEDDSIIVPEQTLDFDSGSFAIRGKNIYAATALGKALRDTLMQDERWKRLETIFVEGHTDSVPAINRYRMGNWELSTLRAISLWKFWTEECAELFGNDLKNMTTSITEEGRTRQAALFSVSGYADTRRREMNDNTEEERRKNRRINIRFVTKQVKPEQLEEIRSPLSGKAGFTQ